MVAPPLAVPARFPSSHAAAVVGQDVARGQGGKRVRSTGNNKNGTNRLNMVDVRYMNNPSTVEAVYFAQPENNVR